MKANYMMLICSVKVQLNHNQQGTSWINNRIIVTTLVNPDRLGGSQFLLLVLAFPVFR
jgi:hypothetical protein